MYTGLQQLFYIVSITWLKFGVVTMSAFINSLLIFRIANSGGNNLVSNRQKPNARDNKNVSLLDKMQSEKLKMTFDKGHDVGLVPND